MKTLALFGSLIALSILGLGTSALAQEFRLTTAKSNLVASKATIEVPALSGNPDAVIIATPLGDAETRNPHPIGAWYYNGKWNIFNTDHANLAEGLTYKVEYFLRRDANHFVHTMTKANITGSGSVIDSPALNGNPNAQFKIFQNHAPDDRTGSLNKYAATAEYDAASGKWFIKNINGERLFPDTAYNIVVTSGGSRAVGPLVPTAMPYVPIVGTNVAGPLTVVLRQSWTVPSLTTSMFLTGGQCAPYEIQDAAILETDSAIITSVATPSATLGQISRLRLIAIVSNGTVNIIICNTMSPQSANSVDFRGTKANVLVLR